MAFPTLSTGFPVESADDILGTQDLTVTVPASCKTLVALVSSPAQNTILSVAWDTAGVNEAFTQQGAVQQGTAWGLASIWILQNPTPGTSKNFRVTQAASHQIAITLVGYDESVTIVSNGGASFTSPAGTGAFDNTISAITTVAGDAIVSCLSDDGGTSELAAPGPTFTGGTVYATQATGSGDSWSGGAVKVASGTSTDITWRYASQVTGSFGDLAVKYVVLRDASPPPTIPTYKLEQKELLTLIGSMAEERPSWNELTNVNTWF
jgi:hypothetical protein